MEFVDGPGRVGDPDVAYSGRCPDSNDDAGVNPSRFRRLPQVSFEADLDPIQEKISLYPVMS